MSDGWRDPDYLVTVTSPEVPEIPPQVRDAFAAALAETGPPPSTRDLVLDVLRDAQVHRTVAGLAASAGVSRQSVRVLLDQLDAEGRLDIRRDTWPNGYRLREPGGGGT